MAKTPSREKTQHRRVSPIMISAAVSRRRSSTEQAPSPATTLHHKKERKSLTKQVSHLLSRHVPTTTLRVPKTTDWVKQMRFEQGNKTTYRSKLIEDLREFGRQLYEKELENYCRSNVDGAFSRIEDKESLSVEKTRILAKSYDYVIHGSPFHALPYFLDLIDFMSVDSPQNFYAVLWHIRTLFKYEYLPRDFVAKTLAEHDFHALLDLWQEDAGQGEKELMLWYFEEQVNKAYEDFILSVVKFVGYESNVLEKIALHTLVELIVEHPEQSINIIVSGLLENLDGRPENIDEVLEDFIVVCPTALDTLINLSSAVLYKNGMDISLRIRIARILSKIILMEEDHELALKLLYCWLRSYLLFLSGDTQSETYFYLIVKGAKEAVRFLKNSSDRESTGEILSSFCAFLGPEKDMLDERTLQLLSVVMPLGTDIVNRLYRQIYHVIPYRYYEDYDDETSFLQMIFKCAIEDENWKRGRAINKQLLQTGINQDMRFAIRILVLFSQILASNKKFSGLTKSLDCQDKVPERSDYDLTQPYDYAFEVYEEASYHELILYKSHCHPRISEGAQKILEGKTINHKGRMKVDFSTNYLLTALVDVKVEEIEDELKKPMDDESTYNERNVEMVMYKEINAVYSQLPVDYYADFHSHLTLIDPPVLEDEPVMEEPAVIKEKTKPKRRSPRKKNKDDLNLSVETINSVDSYWSMETLDLTDHDLSFVVEDMDTQESLESQESGKSQDEEEEKEEKEEEEEEEVEEVEEVEKKVPKDEEVSLPGVDKEFSCDDQDTEEDDDQSQYRVPDVSSSSRRKRKAFSAPPDKMKPHFCRKF